MSTTFPELQASAENRNLVRKILRAVAFIGDSSVEMPENLTDESGNVISLPSGWKPVGLVTPEGFTFGGETETDETPALGHASPVRKDTIGITRSVSLTALEHGRRHLLEVYFGQDLSGITPDAETGEIVWDEIDLPLDVERRLLVIGNDGAPSSNWIMGRGFPLVKLSERGEETWGAEGAVELPLSFDVFTDPDEGTPVRHYTGGLGAKANATALGFGA